MKQFRGSIKMVTDISFFYYYSSPTLPENCYLNLDPDVAYRNWLLSPSGRKIHFEFPVFEDHSYNTICNTKGVRSLIKRPSENEKYIIFRTRNDDTNKSNIIGYYRVGRAFYHETNLFNNNGFVWGIETDECHLLKKDALEYTGPLLKQGHHVSWNTEKWNEILFDILEDIPKYENIAKKYQDETNRLISLFKNIDKMDEWRDFCKSCNNNKCKFFIKNRNYRKNHISDLFSVIHHTYSTNIYSRNELLKLNKIYLK